MCPDTVGHSELATGKGVLAMGENKDGITRREFLGAGIGVGMAWAAGGLAGWSFGQAMEQPLEKLAENIPTTVLGRTGWKTKIIGLGTIFRPEGKWTMKESDEVISTLIDSGINVYEIGVVYGESEERVGRVITKSNRDKVFLSSKSTKITKQGFMKDLEGSLERLRTDHFDAYLLHNYSTFIEFDKVMGPDGGFEALLEAQKQGKTRFIGMTSHGCQTYMAAMRSQKFDLFVIPFNPAHREFTRGLDLAAKLGAATMTMKPFGGNGLLRYDPKDPVQLDQVLTPQECLSYNLSTKGVTIAIPNMSTMAHVKGTLAAAAMVKPLTASQKREIEAKAARILGGVCSECSKPCDGACPTKVPISCMMSAAQEMRRLGYDNRRHGDRYAALEHDFQDCDGCGACEKVCPKKLAILKEIEKYDKAYRESRFATVLQFDKTYR